MDNVNEPATSQPGRWTRRAAILVLGLIVGFFIGWQTYHQLLFHPVSGVQISSQLRQPLPAPAQVQLIGQWPSGISSIGGVMNWNTRIALDVTDKSQDAIEAIPMFYRTCMDRIITGDSRSLPWSRTNSGVYSGLAKHPDGSIRPSGDGGWTWHTCDRAIDPSVFCEIRTELVDFDPTATADPETIHFYPRHPVKPFSKPEPGRQRVMFVTIEFKARGLVDLPVDSQHQSDDADNAPAPAPAP